MNLSETPRWCLPICTVTTNTSLANSLIGWRTVSTLNCGHHQAVTQECDHTDTERLKLDISHFYRQNILEMYGECEKGKPIKKGPRTFTYNDYFVFIKVFTHGATAPPPVGQGPSLSRLHDHTQTHRTR